MKRLVAYSSVSHMGFVMLGLFAGTLTLDPGRVLQMINHGLSTGALFLLVGVIYDRRHTRMIDDFGGLAAVMPLYSGAVPDLHPVVDRPAGPQRLRRRVPDPCSAPSHATRLVVLAATGIVLGAVYMLSLVQRVFWNALRHEENRTLPDLTWQEMLAFAPMGVLMVWIGVHPGTFLSLSEVAVRRLIGG